MVPVVLLAALTQIAGPAPTFAETPEARSVLDWGAVPDDAGDDTEAIQLAVDAVRDAGGGTLRFPRGRYLVRSVEIEHGLTLEGEAGAVLARPAGRGKWERMLTTERRRWQGDGDSPPLVVRGLTFDGNRAEQGNYTAYQLEQQHLLMLVGDPGVRGRLVATVEDCVFEDGVADGVSVGPNVTATVRRTKARDVFRGGVVLHGGYSELTVEDFEAGGDEHWTGIDIEVSTPGWNQQSGVSVKLDRLALDGDFDVALVEASRLEAANVRTRFGGFALYARDSTVRIRDSSFAIGPRDVHQKIYYPHDVVFERCAFVAVEPEAVEADREFILVEVAFETSYAAPVGQTLRFVDTTFTIDPSVEASDTVIALATGGAASASRDLLLSVERTTIPAGFDVGVRVKQGGGLLLRDVHLDSTTGVVLASSPGYELNAKLERVSFGEHVAVAEDLHASTPGSRIEHVGVTLDAERNVLVSRHGLADNLYLGSRTIRAARAPVEAAGLTGDLWIVDDPVSGPSARFRCTRPHALRADWIPVVGDEPAGSTGAGH